MEELAIVGGDEFALMAVGVLAMTAAIIAAVLAISRWSGRRSGDQVVVIGTLEEVPKSHETPHGFSGQLEFGIKVGALSPARASVRDGSPGRIDCVLYAKSVRTNKGPLAKGDTVLIRGRIRPRSQREALYCDELVVDEIELVGDNAGNLEDCYRELMERAHEMREMELRLLDELLSDRRRTDRASLAELADKLVELGRELDRDAREVSQWATYKATVVDRIREALGEVD